MKKLLIVLGFASICCGGTDESPAFSATGGAQASPATGGAPQLGTGGSPPLPSGGSPLLPTTGGAGGLPGTGGVAGTGGAQPELPNPLGRYRCKAPESASASPQTIQESVALINALPKPTSVACFVESLARPLTLTATNSQFSAQPAGSTASPRLFIKFGQLWLSVVIDGEATDLIEFGYLLPNTFRSIKAELHLPAEAPIAPSEPFDRVMYADGGTVCRLCHSDEQREETLGIANAFSSRAYKPRPDSLVSVEKLALDAQNCDWQSEPHRCEMLAAVFGGGEVIAGAFPDAMQTFF